MSEEFPYKYITIEGNIGSGKTSFCNLIKEEYTCRLILEEFDNNPFLPFFYEDMERFALTVELFFMTERLKQLQKYLLHQDLFHSFTVADYSFVKTLLFARKNLSDEEYRIFQKLYNTLSSSFPNPDLLVYFHRNVDILQRNIAKRGRDYEKNISDEYLLKIQHSYFEYFRNILTFPVLIIDLNEIDFVEKKSHYEHIKHLLKKKYTPGVHRISLVI